MKDFVLKTNDYINLKDIINTTKSIYTLYNKLCSLEVSNKKNSLEYKKYIDYLNIAVDVEKNNYDKLDLDREKCSKLIEYLLYDRVAEGFTSNFSSVSSSDYDFYVIRRIVNALLDNLIDVLSSEMLYPNSNEIVFLKNMLKRFDLVNDNAIYDVLKMNNIYEKDMFNNYLKMLEESIKNENSEDIRRNLIENKYNTIFIYKDLEYKYSSSFDIKKVNFDNDFYARSLDISKRDNNFLKSVFGKRMSLYYISNLLNIKDNIYDINKTSIIINKCLLDSCLSFLNDKGMNLVKARLDKLVDINSKRSKELIDNSIKNKNLKYKNINSE